MLESAYHAGCRFDSWLEMFDFDKWQAAFAAAGIDPDFYAARERQHAETLPWDIIDIGVDKAYLWREKQRSEQAATTPDCRQGCTGCGLRKAGFANEDGAGVCQDGRGRYISHLDLQRAFSRAIRRSGLPVKLSEGFNPHYVVSFASALAVGMESVAECVEMALSRDVALDEYLMRMARALPPGLEARRAVKLPQGAPKLMAALRFAEYTVEVDGTAGYRRALRI